jgi:hypothetical protein
LSLKFHQRARVGALSRSRPDNDPDLLEARRSLAAANIAEYIEKVVAQAPPLNRAQIDHLRVLLEPARGTITQGLAEQLDAAAP